MFKYTQDMHLHKGNPIK